MREAQKTVLELGLCSRLFESSDDENIAPPRFIDQAVVVWRNATRIMKSACSDYPNPRTVQQQKFGLLANRNSIPQTDDITQAPTHERVRFSVGPNFHPSPYDQAELRRSLNGYRRPGPQVVGHPELEMLLDRYYFGSTRPNDPVELERVVVHRRPMMTAGEVRMRMIEESRRPGFRYPTAAEVADIQRRFHNPEFQSAMELAAREYMVRMHAMMLEPTPRWAQNPDGSLERVD